MAAFFAIPVDGLKLTDDKKLPMNYVIKYLGKYTASMSYFL